MSKDNKPQQGKPVLIFLKNGELHEGHWLKNANYKETNVNRWRIYKTGKTVPDEEVVGWFDLMELASILFVAATFDPSCFHSNKSEVEA